MIKFSIIISIEDIENLDRCINSVLKQTYDEYEIILIHDGKSDRMIHEYYKQYPDKIKIIHITKNKNTCMRSKAIHKASGEYVLFIKGNDYIEKGLLKTLSSKLNDCPDMIRFQVKDIFTNKICMHRELPFETVTGSVAFEKIKKYYYIDTVELYLYRKEFIAEIYKKYLEHTTDIFFALGSLFILQAKKIKSIGYIGYVIEKDKKNESVSPVALLHQYKEFSKYLLDSNLDNLVLWKQYIGDLLIKETMHLKSKNYKEYLKGLHDNNIFDVMKQAGLKKWLMCKYPKMYYRLKKVDRGKV